MTRLLKKEPTQRLGAGADDAKEIQAHPFFKETDWKAIFERTVKMPWKPEIASDTDTSMFDAEFTGEAPIVSFEAPPVIPDEGNPFANFTCNEENILGDK
jgi:hypothetical protein